MKKILIFAVITYIFTLNPVLAAEEYIESHYSLSNYYDRETFFNIIPESQIFTNKLNRFFKYAFKRGRKPWPKDLPVNLNTNLKERPENYTRIMDLSIFLE